MNNAGWDFGLLQKWQFYAFLSAIFAALTALFGKIGVNTINSNLATLIRTGVILVFISGIVWWRREWQWPEATGRSAVVFLVLSGLATGLSWLCYFRALQLGAASRVAPVDKLSVVFVIILAALFLGEALTLRTAIGGTLIAVGAILLAL